MFLIKNKSFILSFKKSILFLSMLFTCFGVSAQIKKNADSASKMSKIYILDNDIGEYIKNDTNSVNKLIGNVKLLHGSDTLYCDSAYFYSERNGVEAFGDVLIRQADGTEASADYMRYNGMTKVVFMRADQPNREVQLYDGKVNTLWSKEIDYNMNTKIGKYRKRGQLQTETTILESNTGEYNMKTKDARFKGDVIVNDPEYRAVSSDLGYNTDTKVARFFGPSVVTNDKSILQTSNGVYDTKNRTSHFVSRSSILNEAQYIEADTLDYDRNSGFGFAIGNVIAIDTGLKSTLYCGYAQYNEIHKTLLAYQKPLMKKSDGKDSLFIKADTFFSAPDPTAGKPLTAQDSLQKTADEIRAAVGADSLINHTDSTSLPSDTNNVNHGGAVDTMSLIPDDDFEMPADTLSKTPVTKDIPESRDTAAAIKPSEPIVADSTRLKGQEFGIDNLKKKMDAMVYQKGNAENNKLSTDKADTLKPDDITLRRRSLDSASLTYNNTPQQADTSGPRYFVGYHHVLIYSDSLQGKCDSIRYSQVDSLMRMYINPILWPRNGQLKGDMIFMQMDSSRLKEVYVPKNAIMINRSGPEKAGMFDQIQGNSIRGYLTNNKLDSMIAEPNASSIYFIKDEDSAYVGSSEAKSERIEALFENEEISYIYYRKDVEQKTTPMKDVTPSALHLSRFSWQEKERPKTLAEFLEGTTLPHAPELLSMPETSEQEEEPEEQQAKDTSENKQ
jgi:lipopolysaccharide export system protein LptA